MKTNFKFIFAVSVLFWGTCFASWGQTNDVTLQSPDGALSVTFTVKTPEVTGRSNAPQPAVSKLFYEVSFNNKLMLKPSVLGLELQDGRMLGENVTITKTTFSDGEDSYKLLTGRNSVVKEQYNMLSAVKRFDGYETPGALFRQTNAETIGLTVKERILLIIKEILTDFSENTDWGIDFFLEHIFAENDLFKKLMNAEKRARAA